VERRTGEVHVTVALDLDGSGRAHADTGVPFLDHMLAQLGKHARFDLDVVAKGDLEVDAHHTVEDTGVALGRALAEALGDKSGVRRFGDAVVPLDEARARAAVDLSGRPYLVWDVTVDATPGELGGFDPRQARHLLEALVGQARCTVHVLLEAGDLPHHALEACFKALARALGEACTPDPRAGSGSTKGTLA
jgi:imidazoleglycerol-phosphate dehydratase